jgi:glycosyltransferase involved in cell wall biosynthesis
VSTAVRITVIVPCKGHAASLVRCLRSIARQSPHFAFETLVVDSAADPRVAAAAHQFPGVRVLRSHDDLRAGAARNLAAHESQARYLAFIDADCQAERSWLEAAARGLSDGARMVGGPVLDALPWHPVAVADNLLRFTELGPRRPTGPARSFPACNMAVDRAAFLAVGGFPDVGALAGEDTAFSARMRERWPDGLVFLQGMRVYHEGRTTVREFVRHQSELGYTGAVPGLAVTPAQRRQGSRALAVPAVVLKRLTYIAVSTLRWHPARAPRLLLLAPLVVVGLWAWAVAFRRGGARGTRD